MESYRKRLHLLYYVLILPDSTNAMPPHALGEDMDVPFMSCVPRRVQFGTEAIAPPGALILTPRAPSVLVEKNRIVEKQAFIFCTL